MKLVLESIDKRFGEQVVLQDLSYCFESGHIYGVVGRNGVGKTTLFSIISNELERDGGTIRLQEGGQEMSLEGEVMMTYSENVLPEFLTGYEFIKIFLDINEGRIPERKPVEFYLDVMEISRTDAQKLIKNYSHGTKTKLSFLMLYILRPKVILMDEPLVTVDMVVARRIKDLLKEMKERHIILVSSHMMEVATNLCDELVLLQRGGHLKGIESVEGRSMEDVIIEELRHDAH